jgi:hypothetical protein
MGIRIVDDCDRYGFVLCRLSVASRVGGLLAAGIGGTVSRNESFRDISETPSLPDLVPIKTRSKIV